MMSGAEVIKKVRINLLLETQEFADALGLSRMAIYNYEAGKRKPKLKIIRRIQEMAKENGMNIPVEDFLND